MKEEMDFTVQTMPIKEEDTNKPYSENITMFPAIKIEPEEMDIANKANVMSEEIPLVSCNALKKEMDSEVTAANIIEDISGKIKVEQESCNPASLPLRLEQIENDKVLVTMVTGRSNIPHPTEREKNKEYAVEHQITKSDESKSGDKSLRKRKWPFSVFQLDTYRNDPKLYADVRVELRCTEQAKFSNIPSVVNDEPEVPVKKEYKCRFRVSNEKASNIKLSSALKTLIKRKLTSNLITMETAENIIDDISDKQTLNQQNIISFSLVNNNSNNLSEQKSDKISDSDQDVASIPKSVTSHEIQGTDSGVSTSKPEIQSQQPCTCDVSRQKSDKISKGNQDVSKSINLHDIQGSGSSTSLKTEFPNLHHQQQPSFRIVPMEPMLNQTSVSQPAFRLVQQHQQNINSSTVIENTTDLSRQKSDQFSERNQDVSSVSNSVNFNEIQGTDLGASTANLESQSQQHCYRILPVKPTLNETSVSRPTFRLVPLHQQNISCDNSVMDNTSNDISRQKSDQISDSNKDVSSVSKSVNLLDIQGSDSSAFPKMKFPNLHHHQQPSFRIVPMEPMLNQTSMSQPAFRLVQNQQNINSSSVMDKTTDLSRQKSDQFSERNQDVSIVSNSVNFNEIQGTDSGASTANLESQSQQHCYRILPVKPTLNETSVSRPTLRLVPLHQQNISCDNSVMDNTSNDISRQKSDQISDSNKDVSSVSKSVNLLDIQVSDSSAFPKMKFPNLHHQQQPSFRIVPMEPMLNQTSVSQPAFRLVQQHQQNINSSSVIDNTTDLSRQKSNQFSERNQDVSSVSNSVNFNEIQGTDSGASTANLESQSQQHCYQILPVKPTLNETSVSRPTLRLVPLHQQNLSCDNSVMDNTSNDISRQKSDQISDSNKDVSSVSKSVNLLDIQGSDSSASPKMKFPNLHHQQQPSFRIVPMEPMLNQTSMSQPTFRLVQNQQNINSSSLMDKTTDLSRQKSDQFSERNQGVSSVSNSEYLNEIQGTDSGASTANLESQSQQHCYRIMPVKPTLNETSVSRPTLRLVPLHQQNLSCDNSVMDNTSNDISRQKSDQISDSNKDVSSVSKSVNMSDIQVNDSTTSPKMKFPNLRHHQQPSFRIVPMEPMLNQTSMSQPAFRLVQQHQQNINSSTVIENTTDLSRQKSDQFSERNQDVSSVFNSVNFNEIQGTDSGASTANLESQSQQHCYRILPVKPTLNETSVSRPTLRLVPLHQQNISCDNSVMDNTSNDISRQKSDQISDSNKDVSSVSKSVNLLDIQCSDSSASPKMKFPNLHHQQQPSFRIVPMEPMLNQTSMSQPTFRLVQNQQNINSSSVMDKTTDLSRQKSDQFSERNQDVSSVFNSVNFNQVQGTDSGVSTAYLESQSQQHCYQILPVKPTLNETSVSRPTLCLVPLHQQNISCDNSVMDNTSNDISRQKSDQISDSNKDVSSVSKSVNLLDIQGSDSSASPKMKFPNLHHQQQPSFRIVPMEPMLNQTSMSQPTFRLVQNQQNINSSSVMDKTTDLSRQKSDQFSERNQDVSSVFNSVNFNQVQGTDSGVSTAYLESQSQQHCYQILPVKPTLNETSVSRPTLCLVPLHQQNISCDNSVMDNTSNDISRQKSDQISDSNKDVSSVSKSVNLLDIQGSDSSASPKMKFPNLHHHQQPSFRIVPMEPMLNQTSMSQPTFRLVQNQQNINSSSLMDKTTDLSRQKSNQFSERNQDVSSVSNSVNLNEIQGTDSGASTANLESQSQQHCYQILPVKPTLNETSVSRPTLRLVPLHQQNLSCDNSVMDNTSNDISRQKSDQISDSNKDVSSVSKSVNLLDIQGSDSSASPKMKFPNLHHHQQPSFRIVPMEPMLNQTSLSQPTFRLVQNQQNINSSSLMDKTTDLSRQKSNQFSERNQDVSSVSNSVNLNEIQGTDSGASTANLESQSQQHCYQILPVKPTLNETSVSRPTLRLVPLHQQNLSCDNSVMDNTSNDISRQKSDQISDSNKDVSSVSKSVNLLDIQGSDSSASPKMKFPNLHHQQQPSFRIVPMEPMLNQTSMSQPAFRLVQQHQQNINSSSLMDKTTDLSRQKSNQFSERNQDVSIVSNSVNLNEIQGTDSGASTTNLESQSQQHCYRIVPVKPTLNEASVSRPTLRLVPLHQQNISCDNSVMDTTSNAISRKKSDQISDSNKDVSSVSKSVNLLDIQGSDSSTSSKREFPNLHYQQKPSCHIVPMKSLLKQTSVSQPVSWLVQQHQKNINSSSVIDNTTDLSRQKSDQFSERNQDVSIVTNSVNFNEIQGTDSGASTANLESQSQQHCYRIMPVKPTLNETSVSRPTFRLVPLHQQNISCDNSVMDNTSNDISNVSNSVNFHEILDPDSGASPAELESQNQQPCYRILPVKPMLNQSGVSHPTFFLVPAHQQNNSSCSSTIDNSTNDLSRQTSDRIPDSDQEVSSVSKLVNLHETQGSDSSTSSKKTFPIIRKCLQSSCHIELVKHTSNQTAVSQPTFSLVHHQKCINSSSVMNSTSTSHDSLRQTSGRISESTCVSDSVNFHGIQGTHPVMSEVNVATTSSTAHVPVVKTESRIRVPFNRIQSSRSISSCTPSCEQTHTKTSSYSQLGINSMGNHITSFGNCGQKLTDKGYSSHELVKCEFCSLMKCTVCNKHTYRNGSCVFYREVTCTAEAPYAYNGGETSRFLKHEQKDENTSSQCRRELPTGIDLTESEKKHTEDTINQNVQEDGLSRNVEKDRPFKFPRFPLPVSHGQPDMKDFSKKFSEFMENSGKEISMSMEQCVVLERSTKNCLPRDEGIVKYIKCKRLVASRFGEVLDVCRTLWTSPIQIGSEDIQIRLSDGYVKDLFDLDCPNDLRLNQKLKSKAIELYREHKKCKDLELVHVDGCGVVINPAFPHLVADPYGKVVIRVKGKEDLIGVLMVHCPEIQAGSSLVKASESKDFCLTQQDLGTTNLTINKSHNFYYEIQGTLAITGLKCCDFVVYTDQQTHMERIPFDEDIWKECMFPKLTKFYIDHALSHFKLMPV